MMGGFGHDVAREWAPLTCIFALSVLPFTSSKLLGAGPLLPAAGAPEGRHGGGAAGRLVGHRGAMVFLEQLQLLRKTCS